MWSAMRLTTISLALSTCLAGCANDARLGDDEPGVDPGTDDRGFIPLVMHDYSLPPGTESFVCVRQTVTEEMWIKTIKPVSPDGTHHAVLMTGAPDGPDGAVDCTSSLPKPAIYASGVGSQELDMPDGVAVHLRPGDQLLLNLHLFNAGSDALDGTAGIEVIETEPVDTSHEAGVVLVGKAAGLTIPPGMSTQLGECTTPAGSTVFAVAPHMHTRGVHMKVDYTGQTLHDEDYTFDQQRFHVLPSVMPTVAGAKMTVACTYYNETSASLYFGESTDQEMCYALAFVYPAPTVKACTR